MTTTAPNIPTVVILTLHSMSFHTMACRISGLGFDFSFKFIWARCECIQISLLSRHNIIKIFLLKIGPNTFQVWNLTLTSWGSKCQRYCDKKEGKNLSDAIHNGVKVFMNSLIKIHTRLQGSFIYILDSSNSISILFWPSKFSSSSRSNWTGIWTGNSYGSWTDK